MGTESNPHWRNICKQSVWKIWGPTYPGARIQLQNIFRNNLFWTSAYRWSRVGIADSREVVKTGGTGLRRTMGGGK